MKKYQIIGCCVLVSAFCYFWGRHNAPVKVVEKTKIQVVEKIVENKDVKKNVVTTTTKKIDGSVVIVVEDKSVEKIVTDKDVKRDEVITKIQTFQKPCWHISYQLEVDPLDKKQMFHAISVDRQILGPLWFGLYGSQNKMFGFRMSFTF